MSLRLYLLVLEESRLSLISITTLGTTTYESLDTYESLKFKLFEHSESPTSNHCLDFQQSILRTAKARFSPMSGLSKQSNVLNDFISWVPIPSVSMMPNWNLYFHLHYLLSSIGLDSSTDTNFLRQVIVQESTDILTTISPPSRNVSLIASSSNALHRIFSLEDIFITAGNITYASAVTNPLKLITPVLVLLAF